MPRPPTTSNATATAAISHIGNPPPASTVCGGAIVTDSAGGVGSIASGGGVSVGAGATVGVAGGATGVGTGVGSTAVGCTVGVGSGVAVGSSVGTGVGSGVGVAVGSGVGVGAGAALTVTSTEWVAPSPWGSDAVISIVVDPAATGVMVTMLRITATVATAGSNETAL